MAAIDSFGTGLEEVRRLLILDPSHERDLGTTDQAQEVGAGVRRAAVVLLVSHFEGFLKSLSEEMLDSFNDGDVETKKIPRGVRDLHILPQLSEIVSCKDERQRSTLLAKLPAISSLWNDNAKPSRGTLKAAVISRTVHTADSECIDRLFRTFGIDEVCSGEIDVRSEASDSEESHNIRARLHDIVRCRNDIAHGDIDRKPTGDDVTRYIVFLEGFARRLERKSRQVGALAA
jgi:hypothetical protein